MKNQTRIFGVAILILFLILPGAFAAENSDVSGYITIWEHNFSFKDSLEEIISAFQTTYPNVEVDYAIKADGDYDSLLKLAIQSGSGPDLFWTNGTATSTMRDLVEQGVCVDLADMVNFDFISDNALELAQIGDGIYSVPWMSMDTRTCYYNKDMFEQYGWSIPETLDEFQALLSTIKASGITPISLSGDIWCILFIYEPVLAACDPVYSAKLRDDSVSATDAPARKAWELLVDWADKGYFGAGWMSVADSDAQNFAFATGKTAMAIGGSWDAVIISKNNPLLNFGAFAIPANDGTVGLVGTSANGFSVNVASKNIDAALAFAAFCAGKQAQTLWVQSLGAVSGSGEIEASTQIAKEISESGRGVIYRSWQNVLSSKSPSGNAFAIYERDIRKVFTKELSTDEFMDELDAQLEM